MKGDRTDTALPTKKTVQTFQIRSKSVSSMNISIKKLRAYNNLCKMERNVGIFESENKLQTCMYFRFDISGYTIAVNQKNGKSAHVIYLLFWSA